MKGSPTFLCATIPVLNHRPLCSQNILHLIEAKFYMFLETMNNFLIKLMHWTIICRRHSKQWKRICAEQCIDVDIIRVCTHTAYNKKVHDWKKEKKITVEGEQFLLQNLLSWPSITLNMIYE